MQDFLLTLLLDLLDQALGLDHLVDHGLGLKGHGLDLLLGGQEPAGSGDELAAGDAVVGDRGGHEGRSVEELDGDLGGYGEAVVGPPEDGEVQGG